MSSDAAIRAAIETRLSAWAAAQSPAIPVSWENAEFPTPAGMYLRGYLLPADSDSTYLEGGDVLKVGLYQIDLCAPLGDGSTASAAVVTALEALFPAGLQLTVDSSQLRVTKALAAKVGQTEETRYVVPCRLRYRLHATA